MSKEFDIYELNKLLKDLDKKNKNVPKAIKKGVTKTTINCKDKAVLLSPVDTGQLRESIDFNITQKNDTISGVVEPGVEHAVYPEFGTGQRGMASNIERPEGIKYKADWKGQNAQPYMYPAFLSERDKLVPNINRELEKILKK